MKGVDHQFLGVQTRKKQIKDTKLPFYGLIQYRKAMIIAIGLNIKENSMCEERLRTLSWKSNQQ